MYIEFKGEYGNYTDSYRAEQSSLGRHIHRQSRPEKCCRRGEKERKARGGREGEEGKGEGEKRSEREGRGGRDEEGKEVEKWRKRE